MQRRELTPGRRGYGCRPDTLRERLVNALHRRYRRQITSAELIKTVYGARSKHASHGSLMMIVKGAQGMIVKRKLPYAIKKARNDAGEITLGCTRPRSADFAKGRWTTVRAQRKPRTCQGFQ